MKDKQLIDIEVKLAYQEDTIRQLNEVICEQQTRIDQLELTVKALIERLQTTMNSAESPSKMEHEIPPHY